MLLLYHILSLQHNLFWHCSASCLFSQLRNCSPMPEHVHYPTLGWFDFSQSYLREGKSQYFFQLDFAALHNYFTHFELTNLPRNHLAVCKQNLAFTHELQHDKTHKMMCAPSEDSDQSSLSTAWSESLLVTQAILLVLSCWGSLLVHGVQTQRQWGETIIEPPHDKINKMSVHPVKT